VGWQIVLLWTINMCFSIPIWKGEFQTWCLSRGSTPWGSCFEHSPKGSQFGTDGRTHCLSSNLDFFGLKDCGNQHIMCYTRPLVCPHSRAAVTHLSHHTLLIHIMWKQFSSTNHLPWVVGIAAGNSSTLTRVCLHL